MLKIKEISIPGYKKVLEVTDPNVKLHGYIAIHDSSLGPALGGVRMYPYITPQDALKDVLRLAKGMTYKSALAEDGLGGGKSVIIGNPATDKTEALLLAFADAINSLKGEYIAAEDVGTCPEDMIIINKKTKYVAALPTQKSSGDPSPFTAHGVFKGMQAVAQFLWGKPSLKNKKILIQGLGHVGGKLADLLFWEGAELLINDIHAAKLKELAFKYGAQIVPMENVYSTPCDIFSPCALGGILNDKTIPQLRCQAIAGSANNQLDRPEHGNMLLEAAILYAPDYIVNSGGIINAAAEFEPNGYDPQVAREKVDQLYEILMKIFKQADKEKKSPCEIADHIAEYNLKNLIGKRKNTLFQNG